MIRGKERPEAEEAWERMFPKRKGLRIGKESEIGSDPSRKGSVSNRANSEGRAEGTGTESNRSGAGEDLTTTIQLFSHLFLNITHITTTIQVLQ